MLRVPALCCHNDFEFLHDATIASLIKNCLQEKPTGTFAEAWSGVISASNVPLVDISKCLGSIMCRKDQKELLNIRKASFLLTNAMNKKALKEIEGAFL